MIYISLSTIFTYVNDDLNIERELNVPAWSDKGEHTQLKAFYYLTAASVTGAIGRLDIFQASSWRYCCPSSTQTLHV